jgi:hypothetical protein
MSELNFTTKLIHLTKVTLTIVTCCVKIQNDCSESFETRQRFRQGDVLSTLLFNVVLEVIVRRANLQTTGTIYNKETQLLACADDIDIVGRSQSVVRNAFLALEIETAKVGLKINEQKKKYMITIRDVGHSVVIGDKHFEVVKEFVYLGSLMTPTNDASREIQIQESRLQIEPPFTPEKNLYGSVTWVMTKREENQLLVFEMEVLRTICGPKIENGVYRRRYNHEVDKVFNKCPKCHENKQIALRWSHDQKTSRPSTKNSIQSQNWSHCAQNRQTWCVLLQ